MIKSRFSATAIILAGGRSSRMGREKGLLKLGGRSLIEYAVEAARPFFVETLLVTGKPELFSFLEVKCVPDIRPDLGPLMGIYSGLQASMTKLNMVIAYDMPFVNCDLFQLLMDKVDNKDAVVPEYDGRMQPLTAVYSKSCEKKASSLLDEGILAVKELLRIIDVEIVTTEELIAGKIKTDEVSLSVNSMADLRKAEDILRRKSLDE